MKNLLLVSAITTMSFASPALANPILFALNEQPHCVKEVANSETLHLAGMKKAGKDGVKLNIKKSKKVQVSGGEFRKAKAAYMACMQRRLEPHSILVK